MPTVLVNPSSLACWLNSEDRQNSVLMVDLHGDLEDDIWTVNLNIIFSPVRISKSFGETRKEFYIGCTGAFVELAPSAGHIENCTKSSSLEVNYSNSVEWDQKFAVTIAPVKDEKLGISYDKGRKHTLTSSYKFQETGDLVSINHGSIVQWEIVLHRGVKAIRDFLIGNYYLSAAIKWNGHEKKGTLLARPNNIALFNPDRAEITNKVSRVLMLAYLKKKRIKIKNKEGFHLKFEIHE